MHAHTNDDVSVAGADIGHLNVHTTIGEKETICEGTICRQQSDKRPDEARDFIQLTGIQVLAMTVTVEISKKEGPSIVHRGRRDLVGIPSDKLSRTNCPDIPRFGCRDRWIPNSLTLPRDERRGIDEGAEREKSD